MDNKSKRIVFNCLYAVVLFFAVICAVQLTTNAINLSSFKVAARGVGPIYDADFYKYTTSLCITAAIISLIGIALFIANIFIKNKIINFIFIISTGLIIIGLVVLTIICKNNIPQSDFNGYTYSDHVSVYNIELFSNVQAMYIEQFIAFVVLLGINIYKLLDNKKTANRKNNINVDDKN